MSRDGRPARNSDVVNIVSDERAATKREILVKEHETFFENVNVSKRHARDGAAANRANETIYYVRPFSVHGFSDFGAFRSILKITFRQFLLKSPKELSRFALNENRR